MITIIDYGAGNLKSVENALKFLGFTSETTSDAGRIAQAKKLILPGVGSFGSAMSKLRDRGLDSVIKNTSAPLLGICLGLQLLFEYSEESDCEGLGILKGNIVRIPETASSPKIPQMGWNNLNINGGLLFNGIPQGSCMYFVHSFYLKAKDRGIVSATTSYGAKLDVAVESGRIFATQFHPEKSGTAGLEILKNFAKIG